MASLLAPFRQFSWRYGHSLLDCPAPYLDAPLNHSRRPSEMTTPLIVSHGLAVPCDSQVVSSIVRLLKWRSPTAIFWAVWAVAVNAIQRVSIWAWPHVGKKRLKALSPSIADGDAERAVSAITFGRLAQASLLNPRPYDPLRRSGFSMSRGAKALEFAVKATATFGVAILEMGSTYYALLSAVASASPECAFALMAFNERNNGQSSERLTSQVLECWHYDHILPTLNWLVFSNVT